MSQINKNINRFIQHFHAYNTSYLPDIGKIITTKVIKDNKNQKELKGILKINAFF